MNLIESAPQISHESLSEALIAEFCAQHGGSIQAQVELLDPTRLEKHGRLRETFERLASRDWCFGHAPQFGVQFSNYLSWGFVEIFIDSNEGRITKARVFSDALYPEMIEGFESALAGKDFAKTGIAAAVVQTRLDFPERSSELEELELWLKTEVEVD